MNIRLTQFVILPSALVLRSCDSWALYRDIIQWLTREGDPGSGKTEKSPAGFPSSSSSSSTVMVRWLGVGAAARKGGKMKETERGTRRECEGDAGRGELGGQESGERVRSAVSISTLCSPSSFEGAAEEAREHREQTFSYQRPLSLLPRYFTYHAIFFFRPFLLFLTDERNSLSALPSAPYSE